MYQNGIRGWIPPYNDLSGVEIEVQVSQGSMLRSGNLAPICKDKFVHIFESEEEVLLVLNENLVNKNNTRSSTTVHEMHDLTVNHYT